MMTDSFTSNHLEQAQHNSVYDLQNLDSLRKRGLDNDESALRAAAEQFEAIFMNMMLKSMRKANAVFEEDNPMNSRHVEYFRDMHDNQLNSELSSKGALGLADLMVQQLSPTKTGNHTPSDFLPAGRVAGSTESVPYAGARDVAVPTSRTTRSDTLVLAAQDEPWQPGDPMEFLESLAPYAQKAADKAGIAPESMLAQAALETGWGRHVVQNGKGESSNNLFNIKADGRWNGDRAEATTTEYYDGKPQRENAFFRSYQSVAESFADYVDFLQRNPRYQNALEAGKDSMRFTDALQDAGYATDPAYARKLQTIMNSDAMQKVREKFGF
ncbi:flagellar assembly peptidoglycan hydrolase FlgJ [Aliidiomarina sp. Khilg15.8]